VVFTKNNRSEIHSTFLDFLLLIMSGAPRPGGGYGNGYGSYARSHAGNSGRGGTDGGRDVRRNERGQEQGRGAHAAYRGHDDFSRRPPPPPARAPERDIERSRDNRQVPSSDRHHELNKPKHDSDDRGYGPGTRKLDGTATAHPSGGIRMLDAERRRYFTSY
jgi:hypothetical protein